LNYASIYSHSLVKSREAYRAINDLLEQRLLTASSTAALFSDQLSDEALRALADSYPLMRFISIVLRASSNTPPALSTWAGRLRRGIRCMSLW